MKNIFYFVAVIIVTTLMSCNENATQQTQVRVLNDTNSLTTQQQVSNDTSNVNSQTQQQVSNEKFLGEYHLVDVIMVGFDDELSSMYSILGNPKETVIFEKSKEDANNYILRNANNSEPIADFSISPSSSNRYDFNPVDDKKIDNMKISSMIYNENKDRLELSLNSNEDEKEAAKGFIYVYNRNN